MWIMDFGNDDNFHTSWLSNPTVKSPWYEVVFDKDKPFNAIVITEEHSNISRYRLEYFQSGVWKPLFSGENKDKVKIHRFNRVWGGKVRIQIDQSNSSPGIAEFAVYDERR
jgi:alpha-L-fucosidase